MLIGWKNPKGYDILGCKLSFDTRERFDVAWTPTMITLKSSGDGLTITLSDGPWSKVLAELALELERPRAVEIFRAPLIRIETGERALTPLQVEELAWLLELHDIKFEWSSNGTQTPLPGLTEPRTTEHPTSSAVAVWEEAALCPRTLRSGQTIRYAGHVAVMGDVNAGAEIVAAGDVLVWGRVRGVVHAGASGNDNAVVGALMLAPTQLRIGKHIARAPDELQHPQRGPEIARVREGRIIIEGWKFKD
ncbi:MAG: septum site-determining protein MinC [Anaerolineae bacterium]|nr:septum site-determining protein MinC [Anaerolineae bacterium]